MNPASDLFGWAILFATFVGPVAAVVVTRWIDDSRSQRERRMDIFRTLMANRAAGLSDETIKSLNLIEIDFYNKPRVISAWKEYFLHLCTVAPSDEAQGIRFAERRQRLNVALLDAIAKAVGYKMEQLSILEGGYYPNLAAQVQADSHAIRTMLAAIAHGNASVPVSIVSLVQADTDGHAQAGKP